MGLFIDEVGKFITQSNDYFYPAAAPIIYAFFLLTVLIYFQVRKPPRKDARSELYRALDAIEEVLDHDLDSRERTRLKSRLKLIREEAEHPDLAKLADSLLAFIDSDAIYTTPTTPGFWLRLKNKLLAFEAQWITQGRLRAILSGGLLALGTVALVELAQFLWTLRDFALLQSMVNELVVGTQVTTTSALQLVYCQIGYGGHRRLDAVDRCYFAHHRQGAARHPVGQYWPTALADGGQFAGFLFRPILHHHFGHHPVYFIIGCDPLPKTLSTLGRGISILRYLVIGGFAQRNSLKTTWTTMRHEANFSREKIAS